MSIRQDKYNKLLLKELSYIFQKQSDYLVPKGTFITISGVRISPDLGIANVYISVFPEAKRQEVLTNLELQNKEVRKLLANSIRNQARIIPTLNFFIDDTQDYVAHIEEVFKKIQEQDAKIHPKEDEKKDE